MQSTIETIRFAPGHFWCLHVASHDQIETPYGCLHAANRDQMETLYRELSRRFQSEAVTGIVVTPANLDTVRRRFLREPTVIEWLTQNSDLSASDAATIIAGFPLHVAPRMCQNARNPMQFLGLAAAIAKKPDVIVYATSGMDPRGISLIHRYAPDHYPDGCLIHVSAHPIGQSQLCPARAQCAIVAFNSHESDA